VKAYWSSLKIYPIEQSEIYKLRVSVPEYPKVDKVSLEAVIMTLLPGVYLIVMNGYINPLIGIYTV
jgi:hypothetical protein